MEKNFSTSLFSPDVDTRGDCRAEFFAADLKPKSADFLTQTDILCLPQLLRRFESIEKSEASMNAQALKKFVDENQKLASECGNLLSQCKKLVKECLLYHQDRDALMEFVNESDERAREAEARVREWEDEIGRMSEEIQIRKRQFGDGEEHISINKCWSVSV